MPNSYQRTRGYEDRACVRWVAGQIAAAPYQGQRQLWSVGRRTTEIVTTDHSALK
jgi:hypothetical protein